MTALLSIGRFVVDFCILVAFGFITLTVYTLYTENPVVVDAIYCATNTDSNFDYQVCMIRN